MDDSLLRQTNGRCPSSKPFCFVNIMHASAVERASLTNPLPGSLHSITGLVQLDLFFISITTLLPNDKMILSIFFFFNFFTFSIHFSLLMNNLLRMPCSTPR